MAGDAKSRYEIVNELIERKLGLIDETTTLEREVLEKENEIDEFSMEEEKRITDAENRYDTTYGVYSNNIELCKKLIETAQKSEEIELKEAEDKYNKMRISITANKEKQIEDATTKIKNNETARDSISKQQFIDAEKARISEDKKRLENKLTITKKVAEKRKEEINNKINAINQAIEAIKAISANNENTEKKQ
jgi:hypothetical protein